MIDRPNFAVAYNHVGLSIDDRLDKLGDVVAVVLVIRVGIDDDIGSMLERELKTGHERESETLIVTEGKDMISSLAQRQLGRPVAAAIVNDEPFHNVKARNRAW